MKILALHTPKGGSGKSTAARELAVAAARAGRHAALADLDPQETTTGWYRRRQAEAPALVRYAPGDGSTAALEAAGLDLLVVDTPPARPAFLPALESMQDRGG